MARYDFDIDLSDYRSIRQRLASLLPGYRRRINDTMARGARNGLNDVLDEWKRESTELAPLDTGTLRRGIQTEVSGQDLNVRGGISVSAVEMTGSGRFDYAHYIHEVYPEKYGDSFQTPATPGTIPRFLDKPAEENQARWVRMIEDEIKAEMRAAGYEVR